MYVPVTTKEDTTEKIARFSIYGVIDHNNYNFLLCRIWDGPLNGYYSVPRELSRANRPRWADEETRMFKGLYMPITFCCSENDRVEKRVFFSDKLRRINR